MGMIEFFSEHYFLAWCALWLGWPAFSILNAVVFKLPNRLLRSIKVVLRGWPPAHLDADGDFKPEPKPVKE